MTIVNNSNKIILYSYKLLQRNGFEWFRWILVVQIDCNCQNKERRAVSQLLSPQTVSGRIQVQL